MGRGARFTPLPVGLLRRVTKSGSERPLICIASGPPPRCPTEGHEHGAARNRRNDADRSAAGRPASVVRPRRPESPLQCRAHHEERSGRYDDDEQGSAAAPRRMKQNDHGGRRDDRESTVDPRCSGHPPAVVCEPVLDFVDGPCPGMPASAVRRRDDGQRPSNDREKPGDRAYDSEQDHPKARPGSGRDVEVGDAHAEEAIGQERRSFFAAHTARSVSRPDQWVR